MDRLDVGRGTAVLLAPAVASDGYRPRTAEAQLLHGVVRDHLEEFLREAARRSDGAGLPDFVQREFREFLSCGVLARGFARVRCGDCAFERLVPFSCKGRGSCPSCGDHCGAKLDEERDADPGS